MSRSVQIETEHSPYAVRISVGAHTLHADEPNETGGADTGPDPYELLLAALGSCTAITLWMYAERKRWPLQSVEVVLRHSKTQAAGDSEVHSADQIERQISFIGALSREQRQRLLQVAMNCPVHRTLTSQVRINTSAVEPTPASTGPSPAGN